MEEGKLIDFMLFDQKSTGKKTVFCGTIIIYPVWLQNRLIFTGLEPFLSHTEKSSIASYYVQFSTNIKTGFDLTILYLGKLSIIRCDK